MLDSLPDGFHARDVDEIRLREVCGMSQVTNVIDVDLEVPLSEGWNRLLGMEVSGRHVRVDVDRYFFRYESPSWLLCDWKGVRTNLLDAEETEETSLEQQALDYVREHGRSTDDPADVLRTAEHVYRYLFRDEHLDKHDLRSMGVTERHLRILRETATMMALNRVELDGHISNVSPAWFFPVCAQRVYDLDDAQAGMVDELYHGTFFDESRRAESVRAHAALGGRLVHGCSAVPCMAGGCVVPFGTDIARFRSELDWFKGEWMNRIAVS